MTSAGWNRLLVLLRCGQKVRVAYFGGWGEIPTDRRRRHIKAQFDGYYSVMPCLHLVIWVVPELVTGRWCSSSTVVVSRFDVNNPTCVLIFIQFTAT